MKMPAERLRSSLWLAFAALWLGIGLIDACQTVFPMRAQGMHHAWVALFVMLVASWLPWAAATPLVIGLTQRFPLLRARINRPWLLTGLSEKQVDLERKLAWKLPRRL